MEEFKYINEPLLEFSEYKEKHNSNSERYFDKLVKKSKIDVEVNREQTKKIDNLEEKCNNFSKSFKKLKTWKIINIIFIVLFALVAVGSILLITLMNMHDIIVISIAAVSPVFFILTMLLQFLVIDKKLKNMDDLLKETTKKYNDELAIGLKQVAPLLYLFRPGMKIHLFNQTMPQAMMDDYFNNQRLGSLVNQYGLNSITDKNKMVISSQSGSINGNPYVFLRTLDHEMGMKKYTGSLVIFWTERSFVNGRLVTQRKSQTLVATISKPCPYYNYNTFMIFGSNAAPDISFSREPQSIHEMSEEKRRKFVKKYEKVIDKRKKENVNFTALANLKFEAYWNSLDRDDEHQYRLLFSPLAQQNICKILEDSQIGFGDNFSYFKRKKINYLSHSHLSSLIFEDMLWSYNRIYSYDTIKKMFMDEQNDYFKKVYFALAPYFAIPIFQQVKAKEYEYYDYDEANLNEFEYERRIASLDENLFKHPLVKTRHISKTKYIGQNNGSDRVLVSDFGYDIVDRIEYVGVYGRDGKMHNVPVPWQEYIRYDRSSEIDIPEQKFNIVLGDDENLEEKNNENTNNLLEGQILGNETN
ncbi:DUF677 domain-containing protein [Mycoplasma sp. U97]|uniref:DUF677 domain-containing protein n=1 Tax=Mycoplasma tauri TaxID=547987 RepID=UPI001CBB7953|nr:DUF677 domain-containing protein [Mycoplasma tauri]MBZ4212777.1 DUF677 domain-containing protein [Mycoplasma tauri]